jgi:signal transduction histidine kinase
MRWFPKFKFRPITPKTRLYQQIVVIFVLAVLLPLLGVSFIIYNINQTALRKELTSFTEYTAKGIFGDLTTEMAWHRRQNKQLAGFALRQLSNGFKVDAMAQQLFLLSPEHEAIGLYDTQGRLRHGLYNQSRLPQRRRLPAQWDTHALSGLKDALATTAANAPPPLQFEVLDAPQPSPTVSALSPLTRPTDPRFYLRVWVPLAANRLGLSGVLLQSRFGHLAELLQDREKLIHDGLVIVDANGFVMASGGQNPLSPVPMVGADRPRLSPSALKFFRHLQPGVTQIFSTKQETVSGLPARGHKASKQVAKVQSDDDDGPELEKVFVKMPEIHWGIILESPYHVRQKYVKRARDQSLLLILACLALVAGLAVFYAYGISRNFRQLIKGTKAMAEGNYARRIRLITNWVTPYEIIYLVREFNRVARRTHDSYKALETANRELAQLDELKSNLIDTVSHELRTPLTSIKGYTSRLLRYDQKLEPETRLQSLRVVKQQADRLSRLVDDLLVIPELEQGRLRVFLDRVDPAETLERCVHTIHDKAHRDITIQSALPGESWVLADPDRLEQVVLNLLDNAVKYSPPNSPIVVTLQPANAPKTAQPPHVAIAVGNPCDPIPEDELQTLFEKFKRLDEKLTRTTRGSGLGLFITKSLVEAMGGDIRLHYQDGQFTATVTLPLATQATASSTAPMAILSPEAIITA